MADETELKDAISKQFSGEIINETENRAVLHTALRSQNSQPTYVDGKDITDVIQESQNKMEKFCDEVISG